LCFVHELVFVASPKDNEWLTRADWILLFGYTHRIGSDRIVAY
jgi:hypothetical protein